MDNDNGSLLACLAFDKDFPVSDWMMVTVETWPSARRRLAVQATEVRGGTAVER